MRTGRERIANPPYARYMSLMPTKSGHLSYRRVHSVHHAQKFAKLQGVPLNTNVVLNLTVAGVDESHASGFVSKLIAQRFSPWFRRAKANLRSVPPTYIWVRENKGGAGLHWALHLPNGMKTQFAKKVAIWIAEISKSEVPSNAIHIGPAPNCHGLRLYMLKGADPQVAGQFGIKSVPQGDVSGSRSGVSRNLQRASRTRAGYKPKRWLVPARSRH